MRNDDVSRVRQTGEKKKKGKEEIERLKIWYLMSRHSS